MTPLPQMVESPDKYFVCRTVCIIGKMPACLYIRKIIYHVLNNRREGNKIINEIERDNKIIIKDPMEIANEMNKYYTK